MPKLPVAEKENARSVEVVPLWRSNLDAKDGGRVL